MRRASQWKCTTAFERGVLSVNLSPFARIEPWESSWTTGLATRAVQIIRAPSGRSCSSVVARAVTLRYLWRVAWSRPSPARFNIAISGCSIVLSHVFLQSPRMPHGHSVVSTRRFQHVSQTFIAALQPLHTSAHFPILVAASSLRQWCHLDMILTAAIGFDRCGMRMRLSQVMVHGASSHFEVCDRLVQWRE